jgi:hypothetical protein
MKAHEPRWIYWAFFIKKYFVMKNNQKEELFLKAIKVLKNGYIKFSGETVVYLSAIAYINPIFGGENHDVIAFYEIHFKNGKFIEVDGSCKELFELIF